MGNLASPFAVAIPLSWLLVGITSALFHQLRVSRGLDYGFGTELFATLLAVDLAVVLGVVDPACVLASEFLARSYPLLAMCLALLTIVAAIYAVKWEGKAMAAWRAFDASREAWTRVEQFAVLGAEWMWSYLATWATRVAISTAHLVWIVRLPKWMQ